MKNHVLNFGLVFELLLACVICYAPGINVFFRAYPLRWRWLAYPYIYYLLSIRKLHYIHGPLQGKQSLCATCSLALALLLVNQNGNIVVTIHAIITLAVRKDYYTYTYNRVVIQLQAECYLFSGGSLLYHFLPSCSYLTNSENFVFAGDYSTAGTII